MLYPLIASIATLALHFAVGLGWGLSAFVSFVGWPLAGTIVTADDDLPGGFSNPDGTIPPPWLTAPWWGQLSAGFAVSALVAAAEAGLHTQSEILFAAVTSAAAVLAIALLRRPLP
jgi:hypothetical protein